MERSKPTRKQTPRSRPSSSNTLLVATITVLVVFYLIIQFSLLITVMGDEESRSRKPSASE